MTERVYTDGMRKGATADSRPLAWRGCRMVSFCLCNRESVSNRLLENPLFKPFPRVSGLFNLPLGHTVGTKWPRNRENCRL